MHAKALDDLQENEKKQVTNGSRELRQRNEEELRNIRLLAKSLEERHALHCTLMRLTRSFSGHERTQKLIKIEKT